MARKQPQASRGDPKVGRVLFGSLIGGLGVLGVLSFVSSLCRMGEVPEGLQQRVCFVDQRYTVLSASQLLDERERQGVIQIVRRASAARSGLADGGDDAVAADDETIDAEMKLFLEWKKVRWDLLAVDEGSAERKRKEVSGPSKEMSAAAKAAELQAMLEEEALQKEAPEGAAPAKHAPEDAPEEAAPKKPSLAEASAQAEASPEDTPEAVPAEADPEEASPEADQSPDAPEDAGAAEAWHDDAGASSSEERDTAEAQPKAAPPNPPDAAKTVRQERQSAKAATAAAAAPQAVVIKGGPRVVVVIPFRDRDVHLAMFKEHWRSYAAFPSTHKTVKAWDMYVVEQFDAKPFARGWLFNVGYALATFAKDSSKDMPPKPKPEPPKPACVVVQDVDTVPEEGVDYADCPAPTQLSSQIDRYKWKAPYPMSAGGVVAMRSEDWKKINGFSNLYAGWGGEDDELFHRLRLSRLLAAPAKVGKRQVRVIRRPPKGHGRFVQKTMVKVNHTKRIASPKAYQNNLRLLAQITKGHTRWKTDGLSNLRFRIVSEDVDRSDEALGIVYHHVRVRRGSSFDPLQETTLAIRPEAAACPGAKPGKEWIFTRLDKPIPYDLESLRRRTSVAAGCKETTSRNIIFMLVDLEHNFMKIFDDENPKMLYVYLRSLSHPSQHGLIIADTRSRAVIQESFAKSRAWWAMPSLMSVCYVPMSRTRKVKREPKPKAPQRMYGLFQGAHCAVGRWSTVPDGVFKAYRGQLKGLASSLVEHGELFEVCYSDDWSLDPERSTIVAGLCTGNEKDNPKQRSILLGREERRLHESMCLGSWKSEAGVTVASMILPQQNCKTPEGWQHVVNFMASAPDLASSSVVLFTVCPDEDTPVISDTYVNCNGPALRFPAWSPPSAARGARTITAPRGYTGFGLCARQNASIFCSVGKNSNCCPDSWTLVRSFALPVIGKSDVLLDGPSPALSTDGRSPVCVGMAKVPPQFHLKSRRLCDAAGSKHVATLWTPSLRSIVGVSSDSSDSSAGALLTLVDEDEHCDSFVCEVDLGDVFARAAPDSVSAHAGHDAGESRADVMQNGQLRHHPARSPDEECLRSTLAQMPGGG